MTNQSVIARGLASPQEVALIHEFIIEELRLSGVNFDHVLVCPHSADDECLCRKPWTGLFDQSQLRAGVDLNRSLMVGDQESDVLFGKNMGVKTILISNQSFTETSANFVVRSFDEIPPIARSL